MASTFSIDLAGKTAKPYGPGMKVVAGQMDLAHISGLETVNAYDVGLKKLYYLSVSSGTTSGKVVQASILTPGSMDNAATVTVYDLLGTVLATDGTIVDASFLAVGE